MIKEALVAYALASSRQWIGDRSQTVGASEIGQCARRVYFEKNSGDTVYGRDRDPEHDNRWGALVRGTTYERCYWEPALRAAYGADLLYAGADQTTFASEFLSATPDGLLLAGTTSLEDAHAEGETVVLECKTADPRTNLAKPKAEHVYQVQVQIGLIREKTPFRPTHGILSYTDTSFWDEIKEFTIPFDPAVYAEAKDRAAKIMLARSGDDLPPEGVIAGGKECAHCPFTAACGVARANRVPNETATADYDPAELALLEQEVAEAKVYAETVAEYAQRERDAKESVKQILARLGTKKIKTPDWSVTWSALKGRPAWDAKGIRDAAEAAGVDLTPFMTEGEPSDRIQITIKET